MHAENLAKLHAEFQVYQPELLQRPHRSILRAIERVDGLNYMTSFYTQYISSYCSSISCDESVITQIRNTDARSTDLPFIGPDIANTGRAKYMFVFVGSLQSEVVLSMTVLSCFWLLADTSEYRDVMKSFWPRLSTYDNIVEKLGITPSVASQSYVVDAVRVANESGKRDSLECRQLLLREIDILKPELVVTVGSAGRDILGNSLNLRPLIVKSVPFPTHRVPKSIQEAAPGLYQDVREVIREFDSQ